MKRLLDVQQTWDTHWVGDGFPVRTLFSYADPSDHLSPFLLFDYAGPYKFEPASQRRGVGRHPHRGFETVTIIYEGEVEHGDSVGNHGKIGPGDVQWMTAASGVIHEEFHSATFTQAGGTFEVVQLWVNLPAQHKMSAPGYQEIRRDDIPVVALESDAGTVRVIAGNLRDARGPAKTFTPINVWDTQLAAGRVVELPVPHGHNTILVVLRGQLQVAGRDVGPATFALFERDGGTLKFETLQPTTALVLSGTPIEEPVVGHGPFVMNTPAEIRQAIVDYQTGRMGH